MNEKTKLYITDKDYRILYANDAFYTSYPEIKCGQYCYQALGHRSTVCPHCPRNKAENINTFYNEATEEWVKAQVAEIAWEGNPDCYAVSVRTWQSEDGNSKIAYLTEEVRLQKELLEREKELKKQQEENMQKLAMIQTLSKDYGNVYCVDLDKDTFEIYRLEDYVAPKVKTAMEESGKCYSFSVNTYIQGNVCDSEKKAMLQALSIPNIRKELSEKESFAYNYRVNRDGNTLYYQVKCARIESDGEISKFMMGFHNIDEETRTEMVKQQILADALAQAEGASNAKTEFLNNMSHDIRTPMNAILGMTAIAAMHIDDKERVLDALNKITLSGKHLLGLINSVLDMSRIESGKISLNEEEFNLSDSIESLLALFHAQIVSKNLELKVNIAEIEHEDVIGDGQRLSQILINIMGNAVKFTPEGGMITLDIKEKKSDIPGRGCYEFVFEDTGIGMEQDFVNRIFEPFARAADSRTAKIEGSGLGMSIAVNVARMMGGDIKVESQLGKGSKFTVMVYLKINRSTEEDLQMLAALPVLVVDDEETACESACEILNSLEMQAEYVLSGEAAVQRLQEAHADNADFSVVILDWKMPGKDGLETAREIRAVIGEEIPIIILSAYDWTDIEQEALAAGVNAFIEKPLFKSRLTHVLKEVLGIGSSENPKEELETYQEEHYEGKRVLLTEDNELNLEVAKELLGIVGLTVEVALDGKEAVEKVSAMPAGYYDLIFMDIQMPVMNGYEAARQIRGLDRQDLKEIPIIAMTADAFASDVRKAEEAGMNGHIAKPIDIAKLEQTMKRYIKS